MVFVGRSDAERAREAHEPGSRKFPSDGEEIICDQRQFLKDAVTNNARITTRIKNKSGLPIQKSAVLSAIC